MALMPFLRVQSLLKVNTKIIRAATKQRIHGQGVKYNGKLTNLFLKRREQHILITQIIVDIK